MRLYKSLNFQHGRGKYVKKPIVESTVTNVRSLSFSPPVEPALFFLHFLCVYASLFLAQCSNDSNLTFPVNVLLEALALKEYYLDRHLHILLYLAERAWSYAMEIKQAPQGASARAHMHLIRRLSKAAQWGDLFSRLCSEKADPRTALEAAVFMWNLSGNC